jgi:hypothetical protein
MDKVAEIARPRHATLTLDDAAREVREQHAACRDTFKATLAHALRCGAALIWAKSRLKHGEWLTWLRQTGIPERAAQWYMKLARELPRVRLPENVGVTDLSLAQAKRLISKPADREDTTTTNGDASNAGVAPDYIERLVGLLVNASAAGQDRGLLGFGDVTVKRVRHAIEEYEEEKRPWVADVVARWSRAGIEATKPYTT